MSFTGRLKQRRVIPQESEVVPDPLTKTKVEHHQVGLHHHGDFCLLMFGNKPLEEPHGFLNRCREFVLIFSHRA